MRSPIRVWPQLDVAPFPTTLWAQSSNQVFPSEECTCPSYGLQPLQQQEIIGGYLGTGILSFQQKLPETYCCSTYCHRAYCLNARQEAQNVPDMPDLSCLVRL